MTPSYPDLSSKHVLITGGANGIGKAMVRAFHQQNATVHFCDIDTAAAESLAAELPGTTFTRVDLTQPAEIQAWIHALDRIDVLVNNAARDPRIPLADLTTQAWDDLLALNLRAYFLTIREARPKLPAGASIINLSSVTVQEAPAQMSAYVASKGGILALSRSLARELGPDGIRVNTLSPGWIMTERQLTQFVTEDTKAMLRDRQCVPDLITPDEIANVALFLASDTSRVLTGQELLADRGWYHS